MVAKKMDQTADEVAVTTLRCQSNRILVLNYKVGHFQELGEYRDDRAWLQSLGLPDAALPNRFQPKQFVCH